jgi:hypothetical protein
MASVLRELGTVRAEAAAKLDIAIWFWRSKASIHRYNGFAMQKWRSERKSVLVSHQAEDAGKASAS